MQAAPAPARKLGCCGNSARGADRACSREKAGALWKFRSQVQQTDQEREGFGGEKAAQSVASLPVPPIHGTLPQSNMPTRIRTGSAPAKGSGNATDSFRKKAGRALVFPRLYSHRPAPAVELSPTDDPTWHRHHAGRRGCGGRRTRPPPPIPYAFRQQIRSASIP